MSVKRITTYRDAMEVLHLHQLQCAQYEKVLAEVAHWLSAAPVDPQLSDEAERKLMLRKIEEALAP